MILTWSFLVKTLLAQEVLTFKNFVPEKAGHYETFDTIPQLDNLLPEIDVIHYDIHIELFPDSEYIEGHTAIQFLPNENIKNYLTFDFAGLQVDSVTIDNAKYDYHLEGEQIIIDIQSEITAANTQLVQIFYKGKPEKGLYFRKNSDKKQIIFTYSEPFDARYWFPCKDDPSDKALLDMIIIAPDDYIVVSNGILKEKRVNGGGNTSWYWQENYPIASYLISFATGPYIVVEQTHTWKTKTMPLQYYVYVQDESKGISALSLTQDMLYFYNDFIGMYPFFNDKYAMIEAPFTEAAAMENQTATIMAEYIIDDESTIAHELAHQWWGNALTPESFDDIWLNEGFASYFDALFTEHKYGKEAFTDQMLFYRSRVFQDKSLQSPIYAPPAQYLFGRAVYYKGAWVLHMLRNKVGGQNFQQISRSYYETFKYGNVTSDAFIEICESQSGQNLKGFFNQWLYYGGMPIITGAWEQNGESVNILLEQIQAEPIYALDLDIKVQGISQDTLITLNFNLKSQYIYLSFAEPVVQVIIDPDNKLFIRNSSPIYIVPSQSKIVNIFPNPFNEQVTIRYQLNRPQDIEIKIYNVLGEKITTLVKGKRGTGLHFVQWNGKNTSSGTYFCILNTPEGRDVKKLLLLR